jgi:hypothetical protein
MVADRQPQPVAEARAQTRAVRLYLQAKDSKRRRTRGLQVDVDQLEEAFVAVARSYGERHGISYAAWRELGVPAAVLRRAGIVRDR